MKRIRYKQDTDINYDKYYISQPLLAGSNIIEIALYVVDLEYQIIKLSDNSTIKKDRATSLQTLKKKAKRAVKELGVVFEDEVRPRVLK